MQMVNTLRSNALVSTALLLFVICYVNTVYASVSSRLYGNNAPAFVNHHKKVGLSCAALRSESRYPSIINFSDNNKSSDSLSDDSEDIIRPGNDDPDGVPLFDTNERATLFGLEPNPDSDPLDNPGLQFTGPLILFLSIYVTLSLFFPGDGELVLFDNL
ncbi:hypothetical protein ACHAWC_002120 [Mediolabrus comicus]